MLEQVGCRLLINFYVQQVFSARISASSILLCVTTDRMNDFIIDCSRECSLIFFTLLTNQKVLYISSQSEEILKTLIITQFHPTFGPFNTFMWNINHTLPKIIPKWDANLKYVYSCSNNMKYFLYILNMNDNFDNKEPFSIYY